jgi:hypothetical protein
MQRRFGCFPLGLPSLLLQCKVGCLQLSNASFRLGDLLVLRLDDWIRLD